MIKKCRICDGEFFEKPILSLKNMPESAQGFLAYKSDNQTMDINIVQCKFCGTIQLDCEPVSYYRDVIRFGGDSIADIRRKQLKEFIEKYNLENKKIVEVGASNGDFLKILNEFNVNCLGIEHSQKNINFARKLGLNVEKNFLENENTIIKGAPFDAFVQFNFMEHQPEPNTIMQAIYNNLTEDGVGLLTVPSVEYIFNNGVFYEFLRDHLIYFSKESLFFFIQKNGFNILEYSLTHDTHNIIIKKIKKLDLKKINYIYDGMRKDIVLYINKYEKVAVWGASHHAFTILACYGLSNKIEYIIDSSKFKQDKFSIGSNIKIISPESAYKNLPETIIVMAPNNSNEIIKIIKEKFNSTIGIATIYKNEFRVIR